MCHYLYLRCHKSRLSRTELEPTSLVREECRDNKELLLLPPRVSETTLPPVKLLVQPLQDMLCQTAINTSRVQYIKPVSAPVRLQCCLNDTRTNTAPGKFPTVGLSNDAAPHTLRTSTSFNMAQHHVQHNSTQWSVGTTNVDIPFDPGCKRCKN